MITIKQNGTAITEWVDLASLRVIQNLTNEVDTAQFSIRLTGTRTTPVFNDDILIYDGTSKVFGGKVASVGEALLGADLPMVKVQCVDNTFEFDRILAAKTYESATINAIISDLVGSYATNFGTAFVSSAFVIPKIVFNQVPLSQCLTKLADIVSYNWYIDEDKEVHFFERNTNLAPYDLTDTDGDYVFNSLTRSLDGSQLVNRVKVRGGVYDGDVYTDVIAATGSAMAFILPYQMSNLVINVDTGGGYVSQGVGIDFVDTFGPSITVLYNFQNFSFRFGTPFAAGTKVQYSGNPKTPVFAIADDSASISTYGPIEKVIEDTSIASQEVARKRAAAELLVFTELITDASFRTNTSGLRTGMLLRVSSTSRNFDDDLLIKKLTFTARTPTDYQYQVDCISTQRYTLIDLLRKFISPDPRPEDETEVSEQIYAVNESIMGTEVWAEVSPSLVTETITSADAASALDGTTIHWVWGYYHPTSISDTKRMGRFNHSAKYQ